jgi:septal ring factor EnvC (AmiA/AmiB activator)
MELTQVAFLVGMVVGAVMIGSVCVAYVKRSSFGMGGSMLSVLGVLLIGMSVWSTARIEVSPEGGLKLEVEKLRQQVENVEQRAEQISSDVQTTRAKTEEVAGDVSRVKAAAGAISEQLAEVAETTNTSNQQVLRLSQSLQERQVLDPGAAREIRESLQRAPQLDVDRIRRMPDELLRPTVRPPG